MKRGIKSRLLATFFLINIVFLVSGIGLFFMNRYVVNQYTQVVATLSSQYQLSQSTEKLIDTYNQLVLGNSAILSANQQKIKPIEDSITTELKQLDITVVDTQARLSLEGLKNSIDKVMGEVSLGLQDVAADKPTAFSHYQLAQRYYGFVQTNTTTFTFDQLRYTNAIESKLQKTSTALSIAAATQLLLVVIACSLYGVRFANKFVSPLSKLSRIANDVAGDNMKVQFDPALLQRSDEVGSLSVSFNIMFQRLKTKLKELETEKTTAERERAKDEAILGSIGDGMIVTDSKGNILLINDIAASLLDIERATVSGKPAFQAYQLYDESEQPIPTEKRPLYSALRLGKKTIQTLQCIKKDKIKVSLAVTATPVMQQGITVGAIQIIRDITHEKEVDRMKTEFISLASHQLRTPLSAISWFSEMLVSGDAGKLTPDQQEFAQNVYQSAQRMTDLVGSLLNISRIESGRIIIDPKPTDLHELVSGVINDLAAKIKEKGHHMVVSVHSDLPKINIDPHLIGQVYLNLLTNAIKYTPKGGEVSVFISRKGDEVVSQVTDNGYGIPKAEQKRMFQKFFRATNVAKAETDGTGLGMYLVQAIIESSGGKIWFESAEGKGTTFWFSLPMSGMQAKAGEVSLDM